FRSRPWVYPARQLQRPSWRATPEKSARDYARKGAARGMGPSWRKGSRGAFLADGRGHRPSRDRSVARAGRPFDTGAGEQLGDVSGIEPVLLVAELAIDGDAAALLAEQLLGIVLAQADQRLGRTFARAAAMETDRPGIE